MQRRQVLIVGNGMVGQRLVDLLVPHEEIALTVVGEEARPAYDRVGLTRWFQGATEHDLTMVASDLLTSGRVDYRLGVRVDSIDAAGRTATLSDGSQMHYDDLVLATGSYPFVPPIPGHDLGGSFVYRTLDDLEAIRDWAEVPGRTTGMVIGGGLLGLEAASALQALGLSVTVIETAPYPMPAQLGESGGRMLGRWVDGLGIDLRCDSKPEAFVSDDSGRVTGLRLGDGTVIATDLVVFSAGVRPRDELARVSGLDVGERGGVVVDDRLATSAEGVWAIGEVALHRGRVYGLVAPGYEMAAVLADELIGGASRYAGSDTSTKLKLLGVDVASFGAATASGDGVDDIVFADPTTKTFRRLVVDAATGRLLGGALVGDVSGYELLTAITLGQATQPDELAAYVLPASIRPPVEGGLPDTAMLCSCNAVSVGAVRGAVHDGCRTVGDLKACTRAGSSCGGCVPAMGSLLSAELVALGEVVSKGVCEHFEYSRQELFDLVRFHQHRTWADVVTNHGTGRGCEICRPMVGSILASLHPGYILDGDGAAVQDTNDHHLANMQRDGTYSVVPRIPGGEVTPAQLIALGEIARDFDLYTKITGGQRIDLFGAQLHQLPHIWQRVIDAGMESGHAYGKALRTVKSCVGSTWCRYGVQDSVSMAILLEQRYRGLRAPHKLKMAVSGCTRECAEAQSKDVGVIATENGWNLYVGGNGGRVPRHADLFASDLDDAALIQAIDRFVMFYVRTADRLQRTATWVEQLDGGLEYLRSVVFDDTLGIGDELCADVERHVAGYECEWQATLADPSRLAHFVEFVNAPDEHSTVVTVSERDQRVPA
ncbi:MAG TPA: nitrite reductase large subunit NirB [Ilumatobacter sp.]|nr:nitrite reductase large subunit NirB [Ilumatobacter sp.]